jgi:hypothetical protein
MTATINASTSAGVIVTSDTSGSLAIQSNGTTIATASSTGLQISSYNPATSLLTSGTATATTSGTSIDYGSIPSWVKRITISFANVSAASTTNWIIQLGYSGGVETTGYISCTSYVAPSTNVIASTQGLLITQSSGSGASMSGQVVLTLLNPTGNVWAYSSSLCDYAAIQNMWGAGTKSLSGTLTTVRLTTTSGAVAFDAGTINILYE